MAGWIISALWMALCLAYMANAVGVSQILQLPPGQLGEFLIGVVTLPALLWMVIGHWQRIQSFNQATTEIQIQLAVLTDPTVQLDKRFDSVLGSLQRQADLFTDASQAALTSLRSARGALRQEAGLLQKAVAESTTSLAQETSQVRDLSREVSTQFSQLDESLSRGVSRFGEMHERFAAGNNSLQGLVGGSLKQFDEFNARLDEQIRLVGVAAKTVRTSREEAETAFDSVRRGSETIGREIGALGDRASGLGSHLDGLRTAVTAGINDIMVHAERLQQRSQAVTGTLAEQGRQIDQTLNQAGQIASVLTASGTLTRETAEQMRESTISLCDNIAKIAGEIRMQEENLSNGAKISLSALRDVMSGIDDAIHRSGSTIGSLDRKAGEISFAVAASLNRITDLTSGLAQSEEALVKAGRHSAHQVETTTELLKAQVSTLQEINHDLETVADKAVTTITRVTEAGSGVENSISGLGDAVQRSGREIAAVVDGFSSRRSEIETGIADFGRAIQQQNSTLAEHLDRLGRVDETVRKLSSETEGLLGQVDRVGEKSHIIFTEIGQEIEAKASAANDLLGRNTVRLQQIQHDIMQTANDVDTSTDRLAGRASDIERTVDSSLTRLDELQRELDVVRLQIEEGGVASAERLSGVTASMREEFSELRQNANRALERLEHVVASIATGSATANLASDSAEARLREVFAQMQRNGEAFNQAVDTAMAGMQRAEQVLTDEQENLGRTAEAAATRFSRLGQELANNSFDLSNTLASSVERLNGISARVDQNIGSITNTVSAAQTVIDTYLEKIGSLADRSSGVNQELQTQSAQLEGNIVSLGAAITDVQGKARESAQVIAQETAELADSADKTRTSIGSIIDKLKEQGRVLSETEADSRAMATRTTAMLGEKALELANAARQAATEAAVLREADAKVRRDIFLNAAKAVLDGLQSLSVDLTKVLDRDVPEKAWKGGLTRAEMPGFTRRLVALRDQVPESEVKSRFLADGEFRTHVQAYLHQFESLLEQAMANDQGDILSSTLMSSDVGKIYYFLSSAVGRERSALQRAG